MVAGCVKDVAVKIHHATRPSPSPWRPCVDVEPLEVGLLLRHRLIHEQATRAVPVLGAADGGKGVATRCLVARIPPSHRPAKRPAVAPVSAPLLRHRDAAPSLVPRPAVVHRPRTRAACSSAAEGKGSESTRASGIGREIQKQALSQVKWNLLRLLTRRKENGQNAAARKLTLEDSDESGEQESRCTSVPTAKEDLAFQEAYTRKQQEPSQPSHMAMVTCQIQLKTNC
ncbi:hypothetical protein EJB05_36966, partial [Eragrostis curvula]